MKYILSIFAFALIISCNNTEDQNNKDDQRTTTMVNPSSQEAGADADPAALSSILWIDSTHQDLGKIREGQVVDISWRMKNNGTQPLIIMNTEAGCGCTVAEKPEQPIPPGGEGVIKASFNSRNMLGENRKGVTVTANTEQKQYYLSFRVEVAGN